MSRYRKFLALPDKERDCAAALFGLLAITAPCVYSACHFISTQFEDTTAFATGLVLRLVFGLLVGVACGYMLWRRRGFLTARSLGAALIWTGCLYGFLGARHRDYRMFA
jgi:hypothetical protein